MTDVTVTEARMANFLDLYRKFREGRATEPDKGMLKAFAELVGVSDRYLSHVKCGRRAIGHALARKLEEAFKLPEGWLDRLHPETEPTGATEREFIEVMMALFRASPDSARRMMIEALKARLGAVGNTNANDDDDKP